MFFGVYLTVHRYRGEKKVKTTKIGNQTHRCFKHRSDDLYMRRVIEDGMMRG